MPKIRTPTQEVAHPPSDILRAPTTDHQGNSAGPTVLGTHKSQQMANLTKPTRISFKFYSNQQKDSTSKRPIGD